MKTDARQADASELLLHVGLPKTGSTALQMWCHANRSKLREYGVGYPKNDQQPHLAHNHQLLVPSFMQRNWRPLRELMHSAAAPRVCLSTEGLTNHLYDFPSESFTDFREATSQYVLRIFMVLRDPAEWTRSYYKQAVINPPLKQYDYATSLDLRSFALQPRIRRLADRSQVVHDVTAFFGATSVAIADYEGDWFAHFLDFAGIPSEGLDPLPEQANQSCSDDATELIRQINALDLEPDIRAHCLWRVARSIPNAPDTLRWYKPLPSSDPKRGLAPGIFASLTPRSVGQRQILEGMFGGNSADPGHTRRTPIRRLGM